MPSRLNPWDGGKAVGTAEIADGRAVAQIVERLAESVGREHAEIVGEPLLQRQLQRVEGRVNVLRDLLNVAKTFEDAPLIDGERGAGNVEGRIQSFAFGQVAAVRTHVGRAHQPVSAKLALQSEVPVIRYRDLEIRGKVIGYAARGDGNARLEGGGLGGGTEYSRPIRRLERSGRRKQRDLRIVRENDVEADGFDGVCANRRTFPGAAAQAGFAVSEDIPGETGAGGEVVKRAMDAIFGHARVAGKSRPAGAL